MSVFMGRELDYLSERRPERLGRIASVGTDGAPYVVPVGWHWNRELDSIDVGSDLTRSKKFRDAERTGRAAIVTDDLESVKPWLPRGIEVRGRAEAIEGERP